MNAQKRLMKELQKCMANAPCEGCVIKLNDQSNTRIWNVGIPGPDNTPFEKGFFTFIFEFPEEYPFHPPRIRAAHKIYHCNVDKEGKICLDITRKDTWSPMLGVKEVVLAIRQLLLEPNIGQPLMEDIAKQMETKPKKYQQTAKEWTKKYAKK